MDVLCLPYNSGVGAIFGYMVGYYVFDLMADPIIRVYGLSEEFAYVGVLYTEGTFWIVFTVAFTPIPFKVFVLAGGFFSVPFFPFLLASIIGRELRYCAVA